ncbi:putative TonB-dependent receptor [Kordia antarctica]|uniref:Putative TonB-dependent receptor n=1 Tax=Kordia antarctica TaxID=1218801 RepID=A0A7L4ZFX3_9FLAO|nr:TonB-dependent receptor [Kordia antarctica]QHI35562.1 putative TonB-dependent receptor [Kordia antarctica]
MNKYLFLVFAFICGNYATYAQNTLSGIITDAENNTPIFGANVYFPKLEKGTITDLEGNYTLKNLPKGTYKIIISTLGYSTFSKEIKIETGDQTLSFTLSPSAIEMEEIIISTPFHKLQRENVMKVERANVGDLKARGATTLSEGITNIAGVESVTTGLGIGKPVIRGLSSNRVLVYTQGIRLENQQFGGEHGLGVSDAGIESIEVIKGPASLLYGSDAIGGVLYLNPERFTASNTSEGNFNLNYFSNTQGINGNAGFKMSGEKFKFLIRGGYATHSDYNTPDFRVTNTRFNEKDLKTGVGFQSERVKTEIRYNYNSAELGIPEELGVQNTSKTPLEPFQEIDTHVLSSKTNIFLENSSLSITLGYTHNSRKEFEEHEDEDEHEEAEGASLDMKLETINYDVKYNLPRIGRFETIVGVQGMHQTNDNFGEELLIPDATTNDIGVLATSHIHFEKSDIQLGIRYDRRQIETEAFGMFGDEIFFTAIDRNFNSFNGALGLRTDLSKNLIARINLATGFRAPNLAELSSNGVHHGSNRYEVGNSNLDNEQNFQVDLALEYNSEHLEIFANGFYNNINNYIFLSPNGTSIEENPVFNYIQDDARLYGGEFGLHLHPHPLDWLHIESSYETVRGKREDGNNLPLIPANTLTNTVRLELLNNTNWFHETNAFVTLRTVLDQDNTSQFETRTGGYSLLNLGIGGKTKLFKQEVNFNVAINNALNKKYIAHLSRLKVDNLPNIGRNISVGISVTL